jgi:hypothetical protein
MYGGTAIVIEQCHEAEDNLSFTLSVTDCSVAYYCLNIPTITQHHEQ